MKLFFFFIIIPYRMTKIGNFFVLIKTLEACGGCCDSGHSHVDFNSHTYTTFFVTNLLSARVKLFCHCIKREVCCMARRRRYINPTKQVNVRMKHTWLTEIGSPHANPLGTAWFVNRSKLALHTLSVQNHQECKNPLTKLDDGTFRSQKTITIIYNIYTLAM